MRKRTLIIVYSYHHYNTLKIANVIAKKIQGNIIEPDKIHPEQINDYNLIGFGSGIYSSNFNPSMVELVGRIPKAKSKKAFLFSTCGAPRFAVDKGYINDYVEKAHKQMKEKLHLKGYIVIDEFMCPGWNTNSFLKLFGGINKGRPNASDFKKAEEFAQNLSYNKC